MKYLKYTGLYCVMIAIGSNVLKMAEANKVWTVFFLGGAVLWYMVSMWEKDDVDG